MADYQIAHVDAFTSRPLHGNACVVVFDADPLPPSIMQAVAREMNQSETAFVLSSSRADVRARYFTPAEEIPLAGHPTISVLHAMVASGRLPFQGPSQTYTLELEAGVIPVTVRGAAGAPAQVVMQQLRPEFLRRYDPAQVLPVFGLEPEDQLSGVPIQTVSTGTPQLMVPLAGQDALRRVTMHPGRYRELRQAGDFFSPHFFVLPGIEGGATFARHLGVPPDMTEDPFTGSATGGMAAYLWHHGLMEERVFVAEQGHWLGRPGRAEVEVVGPRDAIESVRVAGTAVTVLEGVLRLPDA